MTDCYVYLIHNIKNNKVYVGKTTNPSVRWHKHIKVAFSQRKREKFYLHQAIRKDGVSNFVFSIIQKFPSEEVANLAEVYWINFFNSRSDGYNLTAGGEGCSGRKLSDLTKEKIRIKATGRGHSQETKKLLQEINAGKIPSNLEQLKIINHGRSLSQSHKDKISQAKIGQLFSHSHKENLSKSLIGIFAGERNPQAKITERIVIEIIEKFHTNLYTKAQLSREYNLSRSQVSRIIRGESWKGLSKVPALSEVNK